MSNTYNPSKSTAAKIEALVATEVTVDAAVIAQAQKERAEAAQKAAVEKAKSELSTVEREIQRAVSDLREYRNYAKAKADKLGKLVDAQTAYNKTGDFETFAKVVHEVRYA